MRVVLLGGAPATGKSTVAVRLISRLSRSENPSRFRYQALEGLLWASRGVAVLGSYSRRAPGAGIDSCGPGAVPALLSFLAVAACLPEWADRGVFLEGDRVFRPGVLAALRETEDIHERIFCLETPEQELEHRLRMIGTAQGAATVARRRARFESVLAAWPQSVVRIPNRTPHDLARAEERICEALE